MYQSFNLYTLSMSGLIVIELELRSERLQPLKSKTLTLLKAITDLGKILKVETLLP